MSCHKRREKVWDGAGAGARGLIDFQALPWHGGFLLGLWVVGLFRRRRRVLASEPRALGAAPFSACVSGQP